MKENGFNYAFIGDSEFEKLDKKTQLEVSILANSYSEFSLGKNVHPIAHDFAQQYSTIEEKENTVSIVSNFINKLRTSGSDYKPSLTP